MKTVSNQNKRYVKKLNQDSQLGIQFFYEAYAKNCSILWALYFSYTFCPNSFFKIFTYNIVNILCIS